MNPFASIGNPIADRIVEATAEISEMSVEDLISGRRDVVSYRARAIATLLIRQNTKLSTSEIGRIMNRDHATVLHAFKRAEQMLQQYPEMHKVCAQIMKKAENK